jgi:hypothetical protein
MATEIILAGEQQRRTALDLLAALDLSRPWKVTVERHKKKRSLSANALYWKWLGVISDETGHDTDELHEFFKAKFCPIKEKTIADEPMLYRSTAKLDTAEMSAYMDKVYAFSISTLGILLPLPEEQHIQGRAA